MINPKNNFFARNKYGYQCDIKSRTHVRAAEKWKHHPAALSIRYTYKVLSRNQIFSGDARAARHEMV